MLLFRFIFIGFLLSANISSHAVGSASQSKEDIVDELLTTLPGSWNGEAIETPIGPVKYPVTFFNCGVNTVAGVAELNVSDHYWRFWKSDDGLQLTFLSTFRGNRQPTRLVATWPHQNLVNFHAPKLKLLTMSVSMVEGYVDIRVFHHLKPHVYIRLTRSDQKLAESERLQNKEESCNRLE